MAWRSVAETHADLVQQMTDNGVLQSPFVQEAFRSVDRGLFVYPQMRSAVYVDAPVKQNNLHMSAPHMYAATLEALDLRPNVTFLNVGSGTGWFNTMVAVVAGRDCINHGVEIFEDMVEHAKACYTSFCEHWATTHDPEEPPFPKIEYFHGNGLLIDPTLAPRYDRIYVGAACPQSHKELFCQLLAVDGILVLPVDDEFLRIHKLAEGQYATSLIASVRFAPLLQHIDLVPQLPAHVWSPTEHRKFPKQFRDCVRSILLMLKAPGNSPVLAVNKSIWLEILSFASREWFTPELSEIESLRHQLEIERNARLATEESLRQAKRARQEAIMERDYYRFLVARLVQRLRETRRAGEGNGNEEEEGAGDDDEQDLPEPNIFTLLSLGGLIGGGVGRDSDDDDDDQDEDAGDGAGAEAGAGDRGQQADHTNA